MSFEGSILNISCKKRGILKFLVKFLGAVFGSSIKGKGYFDNSIVEADSDI